MDIIILIISLLLLFRGKLAWVLLGLLALTTSYLGAGTNLSTFPFTHNVSDSGLILYLALFLYILKKNNGKLKKSSIGKYLIAFYIFLLISIFIDIKLNNIDLISIIKTSRHWIFLSCVFIFYYIPTEDVEKLFIYLLRATAIISGIILIEYLTGTKIIDISTVSEVSETGHEFTRGAIPSTFTLFFLILLIGNYFKFNRKIKYFYIILLLAVILASMIRSMLVASVISIIMIVLLKEKLKIKNIMLTIATLIILITIIFSIPPIKQRFSNGIEDMTSLNIDKNINGSFSYRIFHLAERINYISSKQQYSIFGIGNIDEKDFKDVFIIGIKDSDTQKVWQLVTPDIAWSTLFLRLGYLGTFVYILFYFSTLRLYQFRIQSSLALTLFIYLVISLVMISFASWDISQGQFMILPMLAYFYITKTNNETNHER
jgi:hypothetical protein